MCLYLLFISCVPLSSIVWNTYGLDSKKARDRGRLSYCEDYRNVCLILGTIEIAQMCLCGNVCNIRVSVSSAISVCQRL